MFDFLDSDWFIIGLEIVFLAFIGYDAYKYYVTRKKEYLVNIVLAIGFAIWVLAPFYTKYHDWNEDQREELRVSCLSEHNQSYCACMDNMMYKAYEFEDYKKIDKANDEKYKVFIQDSLDECFDDSWF
ncbi:hypothetical protein JHD50_02640 [Sulfurimonas sp. MAG313]|nr:hypothetical protein [Sulfurimonas sp. MAG313]MDF1880210.1 hypothetical protein [Sulfurimonas sp. MAG313]